MNGRHIAENVLRRLYAESMGRCMNPACQQNLFSENGDIIEKAHIVPYCKTAENTFENLIILCPNCHTNFDKNRTFSCEEVLSWKRNRKEEVERVFSKKFLNFDELKNEVCPILEENKTIYEKYYPEILEEIRGIADGQRSSYEDLYTFLISMYCFEFNNHCTCIAVKNKDNILFARNSDFLVSLEKLYMNCLYDLDNVYAFNGNTTAFIEMEDGINEYGLAVGLTFVYPTVIKAGFNSGMLVTCSYRISANFNYCRQNR